MRLITLIFVILALNLKAQEIKEVESTFDNFDRILDLKMLSGSQMLLTASAFNNGNLRSIYTLFTEDMEADNARAIVTQGANFLGSATVLEGDELILSGRADLNDDGNTEPVSLKLSQEGEVLWVFSFEGGSEEAATDVAVLENGSLAGVTTNIFSGFSDIFRIEADGTSPQFERLLINGEATNITEYRYLGSGVSFFGGAILDPVTSDLLPFVAKVENETVDWCRTYDNGHPLYNGEAANLTFELLPNGELVMGSVHYLSDIDGTGQVLTKIDTDGELIWSKMTESTSVLDNEVSLSALESGDVWFSFYSDTGEGNMVLSRWNTQGNMDTAVTSSGADRVLTRSVTSGDQSLVMAGMNMIEANSHLLRAGSNGELPCGSGAWAGQFANNVFTVSTETAIIEPTTAEVLDGTASTIVVGFATEELCSVLLSAETPASPQFTAFPNPAVASLNIEFGSLGRHPITVFDAYGREVMQLVSNGSRSSLNVGDLSSGLYFLHSDGRTVKFVKE